MRSALRAVFSAGGVRIIPYLKSGIFRLRKALSGLGGKNPLKHTVMRAKYAANR